MAVGWCVAVLLGLSTVYGEFKVFRKNGHEFNRAENVIYGTFSRFLWGLAMALVIYVCHYGYGGEWTRHRDALVIYVCHYGYGGEWTRHREALVIYVCHYGYGGE